MKASEITVDVKANLTVDRGTAEGCLKLVELYVNQTGKRIIGEREEDGTDSFHFEDVTI